MDKFILRRFVVSLFKTLSAIKLKTGPRNVIGLKYNFEIIIYKISPLSLILRLNAIFTLAGHVQLKIMPIPSFKTKCYQILVSKLFKINL